MLSCCVVLTWLWVGKGVQYLSVKPFTVIDGLFAVIHSIANTTLFHFLFLIANSLHVCLKFSLIIPIFPVLLILHWLLFLFYFVLSYNFPLACTHRMLGRLLDQAFKRIGHPSQGQHVQLVSILHHLCSDSDPIDQVWSFWTIFICM